MMPSEITVYVFNMQAIISQKACFQTPNNSSRINSWIFSKSKCFPSSLGVSLCPVSFVH